MTRIQKLKRKYMVHNAGKVLTHSWCMWCIYALTAISFLDTVVQLFGRSLPGPPIVKAAVALGLCVAAGFARVLLQTKFRIN